MNTARAGSGLSASARRRNSSSPLCSDRRSGKSIISIIGWDNQGIEQKGAPQMARHFLIRRVLWIYSEPEPDNIGLNLYPYNRHNENSKFITSVPPESLNSIEISGPITPLIGSRECTSVYPSASQIKTKIIPCPGLASCAYRSTTANYWISSSKLTVVV
jgi:hypothetical protein